MGPKPNVKPYYKHYIAEKLGFATAKIEIKMQNAKCRVQNYYKIANSDSCQGAAIIEAIGVTGVYWGRSRWSLY